MPLYVIIVVISSERGVNFLKSRCERDTWMLLVMDTQGHLYDAT